MLFPSVMKFFSIMLVLSFLEIQALLVLVFSARADSLGIMFSAAFLLPALRLWLAVISPPFCRLLKLVQQFLLSCFCFSFLLLSM